MKFIRFFGLLTAFFALVLLFSGCDAIPVPDGNDNNNNNNNNNTTTKNGTVFYLQTPDNKHLFLSIFSTTSRLVEPKAGDKYVLAVIPEAADGSFNYSGTPDSTGELVAAGGGKFTFKPDKADQAEGIGSISGNNLIMEKVPGTDYTDLTLPYLKDDTISADKPFGGPINITPPSDGDGDNNSSGGNGIPTATGGDYKPGKIVKNIEVTTKPNWKTMTNTSTTRPYFEGYKLELKDTGIKVKVTYNDDTYDTYSDDKIASMFEIDPPTYWVEGTSTQHNHKLYYKNGFANSKTASNELSATFEGPTGSVIYGIQSIDYSSPRPVSPSTVAILPEWFEDDNVFSSTTKTTVSVIYSGLKDPKIVELTDIHKVELKKEQPGNKLKVILGSDGNDKDSGFIIFDVDKVYEVSDIAINTYPKFQQQILFDDPRLIVGDPPTKSTVNAHWLSKIQDGSIDVYYYGHAKKKTIPMVQAYNNNAFYGSNNEHSFIAPPEKLEEPTHVLLLKYYNCPAPCPVPVFTALSSISVASRNSGIPIIYGDEAKEGHDALMKKILVYAFYENGRKGTTVRRTDAWAETNYGKEGGNKSSTGTFSSDLQTSGFLQQVSTAYKGGTGKPKKATVTFTSGEGKSDSIEIGAIGSFTD